MLRLVKPLDNTPRLAELPKRLILQLIKREALGAPDPQSTRRGCPFLQGLDPENNDGEAIAVLPCAEGLVLSVYDADEIWDDGEDVGGDVSIASSKKKWAMRLWWLDPNNTSSFPSALTFLAQMFSFLNGTIKRSLVAPDELFLPSPPLDSMRVKWCSR